MTIPEQRAMNPNWLSYLPHHVIEDIVQNPDRSPVGRELRFDAVALFADVSGFTAISEALGRNARDMETAETLVYRPRGEGRADFVARLAVDDWAKLAVSSCSARSCS